MKRDRLTTVTLVLGAVLGVGYIAAGITGWIADVADGDGSDLTFWVVFLCGGGALVLLGVFKITSPAWASIGLVAVGAIAGAVATFWTAATPILALALIVLTVIRARREGTPVSPGRAEQSEPPAPNA